MKFDVLAAPIALDAGRRFARSAMPDAPVVAERDRPARRTPRQRAGRRLHLLGLRAQEA